MGQRERGNGPKLLDRRGVRTLFRVNERTIESWIEDGRLLPIPRVPQNAAGLLASTKPSEVLHVLDEDLLARIHELAPGGHSSGVTFELPADVRVRPNSTPLARRVIQPPKERPRLSRTPATKTRGRTPTTRNENQPRPKIGRAKRSTRIQRKEKLAPKPTLTGRADRRPPAVPEGWLAELVDMHFPPPQRKLRRRDAPTSAPELLGPTLWELLTSDAPAAASAETTTAETVSFDSSVDDAEAESVCALDDAEPDDAAGEIASTSAEDASMGEIWGLEDVAPEAPSAATGSDAAKPEEAFAAGARTTTNFESPEAAEPEPDLDLDLEEAPVALAVEPEKMQEPNPESTPFLSEFAAELGDEPESELAAALTAESTNTGIGFDENPTAETLAADADTAGIDFANTLTAEAATTGHQGGESRLEEKLDQLATSLAPLASLAEDDSANPSLAPSGHQPSGEAVVPADLMDKLDGVLTALQSLQAGQQNETLEAHVAELKSGLEIAQSKRDILGGSLSMLSDDIKELRLQVSAANKATLASTKTVQALTDDVLLRTAPPAPTVVEQVRAPVAGLRTTTVVIGVGILLLSWSLMFYLKTGHVHMALLGLVVVNLVGCATVLMSRSRD